MKVLLLFTGGTIGCKCSDGVLQTDRKTEYELLSLYASRYETEFSYEVIAPYFALSEQNTGVHIGKLLQCISDHLHDGYDGIIVLHGTDTMAYSAAACGYGFGLDTVPIFFVSANYPLSDSRSNGVRNLHSALLGIREHIGTGVFVSYANTDNRITIHRGTRLQTPLPYMDAFSSLFDVPFGYFDAQDCFHRSDVYTEEEDALVPLYRTGLFDRYPFAEDALWLSPFPGGRYPMEIPEETRAIVLFSYHSGTIRTEGNDFETFLNRTATKNINVFFLGGNPQDYPYESKQALRSEHVTWVPYISPDAFRVKLWILYAAEALEDPQIVCMSLGGDVVRIRE